VAADIDCVIVHNGFAKAHDFSQASCELENILLTGGGNRAPARLPPAGRG